MPHDDNGLYDLVVEGLDRFLDDLEENRRIGAREYVNRFECVETETRPSEWRQRDEHE